MVGGFLLLFVVSLFLSNLLELLHNLGLQFFAEFRIVLQHLLHCITSLTQFRVSVREP